MNRFHSPAMRGVLCAQHRELIVAAESLVTAAAAAHAADKKADAEMHLPALL